MADTELLPCPFCGSEHVALIHNTSSDHRYDWDFAVECECGAKGESDKSEEHASIVWNRRAALASRPAEVDDSLADAKRLDWLQSTNQTFCGNYSNTGFRAIGSSIWHGTLREAIDGAMIEAAPSHTTNRDGA